MTDRAEPRGRVIDVAELPRHAVGLRAPLWWGTMLLIAIESTCFAMLFTSYLYVRNNFDEWPPEARLQLLPGIVSGAVLLLTVLPTWLYRSAACAERFVAMRRWLVIATLLALASIGVRVWEIAAVPFRWTGNAYTSVVWMSLGMHTFEIVTGAVESLYMCAIVFRPRIEMKTFEDVEASALFWFFSVFVWLPFGLLFYLDGMIR
jgi:cytochrome c oxidase subunit III